MTVISPAACRWRGILSDEGRLVHGAVMFAIDRASLFTNKKLRFFKTKKLVRQKTIGNFFLLIHFENNKFERVLLSI